MTSIGSALLGLMGTKDPRQQLAAALLGGGAPPAGSTPAAGVGPGGLPIPLGGPPPPVAPAQATQPEQPPQPAVYQSPPQMMDLYSSLQEYSNRSTNIDKGIGMIAASLAQEGNRGAILNSMQGNPSDPNADMQMLMQMQEQQTAAAEAEAQKKRAQAVALQLGLDPETAAYLESSGQLDDMLAESLGPKDPVKRDTEVVGSDASGRTLIDSQTGEPIRKVSKPAGKDASGRDTLLVDGPNGQQILVYKDTGEVVREIVPAGAPAPVQRDTQVVGSPETGQTLIDSQTGEPIRKVAKPVPKPGYVRLTPEQVAAEGLDPTKAYERGPNGNTEQIGGSGVSVTVENITNGPELNSVDGKLLEAVDNELLEKSYPSAQAAISTIQSVSQARSAFDAEGGIITGSAMAPFENEARKLAMDMFGIDDPAAVNTAQYEAAQADVVRNKIKELGTGNAISNADLQFTLSSIGAGGTIPEAAIPRILSIMEIGSYNTVLKHNKAIDAAIAGGTRDPRVVAALEAKKLPVPEISIPADAIAELKADPSAAEEFDEVFGPGAAANILMVQ